MRIVPRVSNIKVCLCLFVLNFLPYISLSIIHDESFPNITITTLAFGSCHNNKRVKSSADSIWSAIANQNPSIFLWTGDSIYAPEKGGVASISTLAKEYDKTLTNETIGYGRFLSTLPLGVLGTWDDHDYGANDAGKELADKAQRQDAFLNFLGVPATSIQRKRDGVYSSTTIGTPPNQLLIILLDTRSHRDRHCIPSIASLPLGSLGGTLAAIISCMARWFSVSFQLNKYLPFCREKHILSSQQWQWIEEVISTSTAQAHIVVSSVQLLTTNPAPESWGHFDEERNRLLNLLRRLPGLVVISGDVHHAEILTTNTEKIGESEEKGDIIEVTSSGLTHSVKDLTVLAEWQLKAFDAHRATVKNMDGGKAVFLGKNYGTLHFDWERHELRADVHDHTGKVVLSTGKRKIGRASSLTEHDVDRVLKLDGGKFAFFYC